MEYTLTMTFLTSTGEKINFLISDVKADVSNQEAVELMDSIIANEIFVNKKGTLVSKYAAYVTSKEVEKFTV